LDSSAALAAIDGLSDTRDGWDCYADYLQWQASHLDLCSPFYVSKHVGRLRRGLNAEAQLLLRRLEVEGKA